MKNIIYAAVLLVAVSCNTQNSNDGHTAAAATVMPYEFKNYAKWKMGNPENASTVLKMLKAWETKKLDECVTYFADSSSFSFDYFHAVMPHDSIKGFLVNSLAEYKDIKLEMIDWESVVSEDNKNEWVTVWYKQSWVDKKGTADSINCVNDVKIENGKIAALEEYTQHFASSKK